MIEPFAPCYLYKAQQRNPNCKIYHRTKAKDNATDANDKWNTKNKEEAGYLTKAQWQERSMKWTYNRGWMLESVTGEMEELKC